MVDRWRDESQSIENFTDMGWFTIDCYNLLFIQIYLLELAFPKCNLLNLFDTIQEIQKYGCIENHIYLSQLMTFSLQTIE